MRCRSVATLAPMGRAWVTVKVMESVKVVLKDMGQT